MSYHDLDAIDIANERKQDRIEQQREARLAFITTLTDELPVQIMDALDAIHPGWLQEVQTHYEINGELQ